jgi:transcription elongation factor Elf1
VTCPSCNADIVIDAADIEKGEMTCPSCGEKLEFEIDEDDEEDEDDKD